GRGKPGSSAIRREPALDSAFSRPYSAGASAVFEAAVAFWGPYTDLHGSLFEFDRYSQAHPLLREGTVVGSETRARGPHFGTAGSSKRRARHRWRFFLFPHFVARPDPPSPQPVTTVTISPVFECFLIPLPPG